MDFSNFKIVKKDKIDEAQEKVMEGIYKQTGLEKYYILGEINILITLIATLDDHAKLYKEDLITFLKSAFKDYDWSQDIINAIVDKYE